MGIFWNCTLVIHISSGTKNTFNANRSWVWGHCTSSTFIWLFLQSSNPNMSAAQMAEVNVSLPHCHLCVVLFPLMCYHFFFNLGEIPMRSFRDQSFLMLII